MKKQAKKTKMMSVGIISALVLGLFLSVLGLSRAINGVDETVISKTPEAILASAGVSEQTGISLPVAYFDQKADECINLYDKGGQKKMAERQFEWTSCQYNHREIEKGLIEYELGEGGLPIGVGGKLTSNRGIQNLERWFKAVEGKSQAYSGTIALNYEAEGAKFSFINNEFYPLDEAKFSESDKVNSDGHNHLFTMNFAVPFMATLSGEETFEITADDDTFVFLDDKLVIDMGGIHGATSGRFSINASGEVYAGEDKNDLAYSGIRIEKEKPAIIRIFHADRDSKDSVFRMKISKMNLSVMQTEVAGTDSSVQVAYDPTDPGFVAPLGETSVTRPDGTRGFMVMATIEMVLIVAFTILIIMAARILIKRKAE